MRSLRAIDVRTTLVICFHLCDDDDYWILKHFLLRQDFLKDTRLLFLGPVWNGVSCKRLVVTVNRPSIPVDTLSARCNSRSSQRFALLAMVQELGKRLLQD